MTDYKLTINGKAVQTNKTFPVLNPATEEAFAEAPEATRDHLESAVKAASSAFKNWKNTSIESRRNAVLALSGQIHENLEELAALLTQEQGKPLQAAKDEILATLHWCQTFCQTDLPVDIIEDNETSRVEVHHLPLGVVGGIVPWNFPFMIAIWKILPAVLTGNTIILKPSPYTPLTALKLGEMTSKVFPAGVINILSGGDDLGRWMTEHPGIAKISFTGSSATGRKIMASAAGDLKRITLELGGNDAGIVLPDVDLKKVVEPLFWSMFYNSGQVCAALKRLYVHEDIYEALCGALAAYAQYIPMGNGADEGTALGPIQNKMQYDRVCALAASAKRDGGRILCGGEATDGPGYFFPVTLVADLDEDAELVREEPFGPIVPILKFSDIDEVIERANALNVGLGGSVWTSDLERGTEIAARMECGTSWVNKHADVRPDVPFGGIKQSGIGIENTALGLAEFTSIKVINIAKN